VGCRKQQFQATALVCSVSTKNLCRIKKRNNGRLNGFSVCALPCKQLATTIDQYVPYHLKLALPIKNYKDLEVWQMSINLVKKDKFYYHTISFSK